MKISVSICVIACGMMAAVTAQEASYRLVEHWPQLADDFEWGQLPNLTIDHDGNIYAFHRAEPPVLKFSPDGTLLKTWGAGMMVISSGGSVSIMQ